MTLNQPPDTNTEQHMALNHLTVRYWNIPDTSVTSTKVIELYMTLTQLPDTSLNHTYIRPIPDTDMTIDLAFS